MQVWRKYAETAHILMRADGSSKVVLTTVAENADLLRELFGATSTVRSVCVCVGVKLGCDE